MKVTASENMWSISLMFDTSHSSIGPCAPSEQSPFEDSLMHVSKVLLSSSRDCGENTEAFMAEIVHTVNSSDRNEPPNMRLLVAFEWTQAWVLFCFGCLDFDN